MDFIGIGPLEIILILVLGFLFFGPEKLPGIAAKAGRWYRNFTRAANNFTRTINEEIEEEAKQIKDDIEKEDTKPTPNPPEKPAEEAKNTSNETDKN